MENCSTLTVIGLLVIGVAIGFILTKGIILEKKIKEKSKKAKEEREKAMKNGNT